MRKIVLLLMFVSVFFSCNDSLKTYTRIKIVEEENINGLKEKKEIKKVEEYQNDSIASIKTYTYYCLSVKMDDDYAKKNIKDYDKTIGYKLLDDENNVILTKKYLTDKTKKKIETEIFKRDNVFKNSTLYINTDENVNVCVISKDFIKQDLQNPSTADFSIFDCSTEKNSDGTYTVLRKIAAKNSLGTEKEYVYKLKLGFKGGNWTDKKNWVLIKMQSQQYK